MPLDEAQVRHVALLSRLDLSDEEILRYTQQLGGILSYIEKLNALDTGEVEPMVSAAPGENVFRADEVQPGLVREAFLRSAPDHDGEYFSVPAVLE